VLEAARREDAVDADEARVVVPRARVWVEVAEEEQDLEGAIECESATKVGTKRLVMWLWGKGRGKGGRVGKFFLLFDFDRGVPMHQCLVFDQSFQVLVPLLCRAAAALAALEAPPEQPPDRTG
jgi:hypothetical protein